MGYGINSSSPPLLLMCVHVVDLANLTTLSHCPRQFGQLIIEVQVHRRLPQVSNLVGKNSLHAVSRGESPATAPVWLLQQ